jgi:succinate-semialdehyde dehydrogenase/glutarate-semialdehyde dehydrogenase
VANLGPADAQAAIAAANAAWPAWRSKTAKERSIILRKWFDLLMANQDDLGRIMTAEQGKPLPEAKGEVAYGASFVEWFAEEAKRVNGETLPPFDNNRRLMVLRQPIGVCAAITPWNFPLAMITRKVAPALAAGCPVVIKPAELTPLTALAAAELAMRAGIPAGVLNLLSADSANDCDRQGAVRKRRGAPHQLHRLHRSRPHPDGAERPHGQEAVAGTGRQRAVHRV